MAPSRHLPPLDLGHGTANRAGSSAESTGANNGHGLTRPRSNTDSVVVPEIVLSPSSPIQDDMPGHYSSPMQTVQQRSQTMPSQFSNATTARDTTQDSRPHVARQRRPTEEDDNEHDLTPIATPAISNDVHTRRFNELSRTERDSDPQPTSIPDETDVDTPTNTSTQTLEPSTIASTSSTATTSVEPVFEQLTIKTRAAAPPPSSSSFSLGSLLPSISMPSFNLNLSNLVPKSLTSGPDLTLVTDEREKLHERDRHGSFAHWQQDDEQQMKERQPHDEGGEGLKVVGNGNKWNVDLDIEAAQSPAQMQDETMLTTPTSPKLKGGRALHRTTSSAEFVAASQDSSIHPMTLHAVARRESEADALRLVRERAQAERSRSSRTGGGGAPELREGDSESESDEEGTLTNKRAPVLRRKESWSKVMFSSGTLPGTGSRSESPTGSGARTPRRNVTTGGLGSLREAHHTEDEVNEQDRSKQPRRRSVSSLGELQSSPVEGASSPVTPTDSAATATASDTPPLEHKVPPKKKGFFSRLGGGNKGRAVSMSSLRSETSSAPLSTPPLSATGNGFDLPATPSSVASAPAATKQDKGKEKDTIKVAKVKARNKPHKDFGKLFLAQELFINNPVAPVNVPIPLTPATSQFPRDDTGSIHSRDDASMHSHQEEQPKSSKGKSASSGGRKKNAVWAIKFSEDGKYLAVGGKDGVVRVWEVLSTPEARQAAIATSSASSSAGPSGTPLTSPTGSHFSVQSAASISSATGVSSTPPSNNSSTFAKRKMTAESRSSSINASAAQSIGAQTSNGKAPCNVMPVFSRQPLREYKGHSADVLDLSWSKNNFLLSSSMDKTVRLWHISRSECLCAFQHLDFVTSIAFHPKDDRFFLSGSLDCKLRLWNIPEKRVHIWTELPELITAVAFTRDGKLAIAGSFVGICMFFEVETFRYHSQFAAKSARGKNSKGRKVTSMTPFPVPSSAGERLLVTSNDSRMRLYHLNDKAVEAKFQGHENTSSQIRASFSDDGRWVISGSEDGYVYIWDSGLAPREDGKWNLLKTKNKDSTGYEYFSMPANIITCATFAPTAIRETLAKSADPVFGDGHTHFTPLTATISGASLTNVDTGGSSILAPVNTTTSANSSPSMDVVIVVADDETGVISIFRNSNLPAELVAATSSKKSKRQSRKADQHLGQDLDNQSTMGSAAPIQVETRLWINGELCEPVEPQTFTLKSPATDQDVAQVHVAGPKDVDRAVASAKAAQPAWAELPAIVRASKLLKLADLIERDGAKLAQLDAIAMGRPVATQGIDIMISAARLRYEAGLAQTLVGESSLLTPGQLGLVFRQPYGVTAGILPFNVPIIMMIGKMAPAIAAGNAIIIKTSEKAPLAVLHIATLTKEAGIPDGIVSCLSGLGQTGALLASHMEIRKISFTGSTRTGRLIAKAAAESNLKDVALELGGKSPAIIFEDADLDRAVPACEFSIKWNSGQICMANSRIYVHKSIAEEFKTRFVQAFGQFKHGDPLSADTTMGPQADMIQGKIVQSYIDAAKAAGATVELGGEKIGDKGNFFTPTVFSNVADDDKVNKEEVFGPVVVIHTFEDENDVIRRANDTEYGLYAAVFTQDIDRAIRVAKKLEAGTVGVNTTSPSTANELVFGGSKSSGCSREQGIESQKRWTEEKSVVIKFN
ncbi:hypothetical protein OIO90_002536 [Microbotryomycetes sp. JL221]|nr:hypothetical protein OIO90_002536 [Microbotryomycetes sp. JL221]